VSSATFRVTADEVRVRKHSIYIETRSGEFARRLGMSTSRLPFSCVIIEGANSLRRVWRRPGLLSASIRIQLAHGIAFELILLLR
jgi:hypothetical protein